MDVISGNIVLPTAKMRPTRRCALALLGAQACLVPAQVNAGRAIVVGSKSDTEGTLAGNLIALVLEGLGLPVERRLGLGPTLILRTALVSGEIGIYPEYTGNAAFFSNTERDPAWKSSATAYERARAFDAPRGLAWLKPAPANNTWMIAVNGAFARSNRLRTMVDFARAVREDRIRLVASTEFVESPAALASFESTYNFVLPRLGIVSLPGGDTAVTARAAAEGISGINAGMVYGTDGALAALDLVTMDDNRAAQIVYEVAPVVRAELLERHPGIRPALEPVFARLDAETLRRLNGRIAVEGELPEAVARRFLTNEEPS